MSVTLTEDLISVSRNILNGHSCNVGYCGIAKLMENFYLILIMPMKFLSNFIYLFIYFFEIIFNIRRNILFIHFYLCETLLDDDRTE
jgi:hypothetical protein